MPEDHLALERLAVDLARAAGRLIVEERPDRVGVAATKSSAVDIVTVMDRASEQLIRSRLAAERPDDGFLGEEGGGGGSARSGITWVVDPIDGTVNYLYGIPAYAVSVAAVEGDPARSGAWRPVAAAIVNPATGAEFHARRGGGAWRVMNGEATALQASTRDDLGLALVATGFGYVAARRAWQAEVLRHVLPRVRDIRRIGSAALDLCRVAEGTVDAFWERGLNPWDLAAGWLVATEAGAVLGGPRAGDAPCEDLAWAAAAGLAEAFPALLREGIDAAPAEVPEAG